MGAYLLKINRLSAATSLQVQSLRRRLILVSSLRQLHVPRQSSVQGLRDLTNAQPASEETPSTTTKPSTQWDLHLSVTSLFWNRTLPTSSREWKAIRKEVLLRDDRTCSSCGYLSPYPNGRYMIVDHVDGDGSNNDLSNLRIHCPPCDAIRHCGFSGIHDWITISESTLKQVEIVRKTREIFESTGVIPDPNHIDPSLKPTDISVVELANMMLETPWKDLPEGLQLLRGFFTKRGGGLFQKTMLTGTPDTKVPKNNSTEALRNKSVRKATKNVAHETSRPSISYAEELHKSSQVTNNSQLPSKTLKFPEVPSMSVHNPRSAESKKSPDLDTISIAWDQICLDHEYSIAEIDNLAKHFNFLTGKWLVTVSPGEVDDLWEQIAKSTLAGTLGIGAEVSIGWMRDGYLISVYNADYTSEAEVNGIRDKLRRLGVKESIAYVPDIYFHCKIDQESWGIPLCRYIS